MITKKNFFFLLTFVIFFALIIQLTRSDFLLKQFSGIQNTQNPIVIENRTGPSINSNEKFLVLYDEEEPNSILIKNNMIKVLEYIKKDFSALPTTEFTTPSPAYTTIIITFENLNRLKNIKDIISFTNSGGTLFLGERFLEISASPDLSAALGIENYKKIKDTKGIRLLDDILLQGKGLSVNSELVLNSSLPILLSKNCTVHLISSEEIPLLWDTTLGQGKCMVFNGTMLNEKVNRGLIVGALSLLNTDFLYPIINGKLAFIDDFPSPIPTGMNEQIYKDYNKDTECFYRDVWWPELLKYSKQLDIKYTGMIIGTYNNKVSPPFEKDIALTTKSLLLYGRELVTNGGEFGLHGYNHQALALKGFIKQDLGYTPWNSKEDMTLSLKTTVNYVNSIYPRYALKTYVPPSNILSPEGREAVVCALPNLKSISSVYVNNALGDAYAQEFAIAKDNIVEMPRLTSGYEKDEYTLWSAYNGITSLGIVSHFVHPDDVLDAQRNNGKSWSTLSKEYHSFFKDVNQKFGWLKAMTASEGADTVKSYTEAKPIICKKDTLLSVSCDNFTPTLSFILRTDKKIVSQNNCDTLKISDTAFLIKAKKPNFSIQLGR